LTGENNDALRSFVLRQRPFYVVFVGDFCEVSAKCLIIEVWGTADDIAHKKPTLLSVGVVVRLNERPAVSRDAPGHGRN
jgi:hypothetical protein